MPIEHLVQVRRQAVKVVVQTAVTAALLLSLSALLLLVR